jgi:ligand-binding sensor domain-containing protein
MARPLQWCALLWLGIALITAGCGRPTTGSIWVVTRVPTPTITLPQLSLTWRNVWRVKGEPAEVRDLAVDGEALWIATSRGLVRLNQRTLTYERFSRTGTSPDVPLKDVTTLLVDDQGRLWAGGRQGLMQYNQDSGWKVIYASRGVYDFALDAADNLWIFYFDRYGLIAERFEGQAPPSSGTWEPTHAAVPAWGDCEVWRFVAHHHWKHTTPKECAAVVRGREQWTIQPYTRLTADNADGVYWSEDNGSLVLYDGGTRRSLPLPPPGGYVQTIAASGIKDGVWLGTDNGLFFSDGRTTQAYLLVAGKLLLRGSAVHSLVVANDGDVWAVTSDGLFRFDEGQLEGQPVTWGKEESGIRDSVPIAPHGQSGLWVLYDGALIHLDGGIWHRQPLPIEIQGCETYAVSESHGEVWVAAGSCGLWHFNGQAWNRSPLDIVAQALTQGRDGKLYVQEPQGSPYVYDGTSWTKLPEQGWDELRAPVPSPTPTAYGRKRDSDVSRQQPREPVPMVVDAEGSLWAASKTHLWHYSPAGEWVNVLPLPGNPDIASVVVDSEGGLWAGGRLGLLHYDGECWWEVDIGDDSHIRFYVTAMAEDQQGRLWVGGRNGLSVYDPAVQDKE